MLRQKMHKKEQQPSLDDKADNCLSSLSSEKSQVEVGVTETEATGVAAAAAVGGGGGVAAECSTRLGSKASIQCWRQPVIVP